MSARPSTSTRPCAFFRLGAPNLRYLTKFPQPDEYPIYDQMIAGVEGTLWVRKFVLPGESKATWLILDTTRGTAHQIALPVRFAPSHIQNRGALGVLTAENDLERIVYRADPG